MAPQLMRPRKKRAPAGQLLTAQRARRDMAARQAGFVLPFSEWLGHNNGPALFTSARYLVFLWQRARDKAWAEPNRDIALQRLKRAASLGMSYEDYTLEILERGGC